MIYYSCKSQTSRLQLLIRLSGSAAPSSCLWALPCGIASALVKYCRDEKECREWFGWETWEEHPGVLSNTAPWTGFTVLVAFLIVFRASQSYGRYMQVTMVDAQKSGILSIPPPILSRVFQQLGRGITVFHDALKLAEIPMPFCYAQAVDLLLVMHWLVTPAVVHIWTTTAGWAGCAGFLVSFIAFCLNSTAVTIESPFGRDANDLGWEEFQREFNMYLLVLLTPVASAPCGLSRRADVNGCNDIAESKERLLVEHCFVSAWMSEHRQDLWMRLRSCNTLEVAETRELSTVLERDSIAGLARSSMQRSSMQRSSMQRSSMQK